jgi:hypothetical protein
MRLPRRGTSALFATSVAVLSTGWLWGGVAGAATTAPTAAGTTTIYRAAGASAGTAGYSGDGGPAGAAKLNAPSGVSEDLSGNTYWGDTGNNVVRKVTSSSTGIISTMAGDGTYGYSGDGGPAKKAQLALPSGTAVDKNGALYIADTANNVIRKVNSAGIISTFAGNSMCDMNNAGINTQVGDGGPATSAELCSPTGVAVDNNLNVYIADTGDNRIRKVTPAGTISTIAGNGQYGSGGDGGPAIHASLFLPTSVALDAINDVFIADTANNKVRVVNTSGTIHTFAGTGASGFGGDGGPATSARLSGPSGIGIDGSGKVYISDTGNNRLRKVVAANGVNVISTYAGTGAAGNSGDGGSALSASLNSPTGNVASDNVHVYFADTGNNRGRGCTDGPPPVIAEIGSILLLPLSALLIGGALYLVMRRRRNAAMPVPAI